MPRIRLFIAAHLAAVLSLYALAVHIGDGWASPPMPALAGSSAVVARQPDRSPDPSFPSALLAAPDPADTLRTADHDLVRRSALQDLQSPWDRDQHANALISGK